MGGTGSVVQHDRGSYNRAGERSLLKLYNRNRRDDRLSNKLLTNDGGHSKAMTTVGDNVDKVAGNRRAERARARATAMIQMYNGCHADLGPALAHLRRSLRKCSINGTGWATVIAVSAELEQVGVSAHSGTILTLADQGNDTHHAQEQFPDNKATAVASPETRLVHWPSVIDFLEDGLDCHVETRATIPECKKRRQLRSNSPEQPNQSNASRLNGEKAGRADIEESVPRAGESNDGGSTNPETTPEPNLRSGDAFATEVRAHRQNERNDSLCNGITLVEQGLFKIDAGLRELEFNGAGLSSLRIEDALDSIRGILEVKVGVHCGREGNCRLTVSEEKPQNNDTPLGSPEGTTDGCRVPEKALVSMQGLDTERLVQAACMAGKRGDVAALKDLAGSVDLRTSDTFGRNVLYYTSLCGHVQAAHFVAVQAYGGVEGVPEKERWECRKNALSEEIRRYLDTGILPSATTPAQRSKSDERRPVQAVPVREKNFGSAAASIQSGMAEELPESMDRANGGGPAVNVDETTSRSDAHHAAPPAEATISIASLFGWGHDRDKNEDY